MKNDVQSGHIVECTAPGSGVVSGGGYLIGALFVVALTTAASGELFAGAVVGVFELPNTNAHAPSAGAKVSWDTTTGRVLAPGSGKVPIGVAVKAAAGTDATVLVRLDGHSTAAA